MKTSTPSEGFKEKFKSSYKAKLSFSGHGPAANACSVLYYSLLPCAARYRNIVPKKDYKLRSNEPGEPYGVPIFAGLPGS